MTERKGQRPKKRIDGSLEVVVYQRRDEDKIRVHLESEQSDFAERTVACGDKLIASISIGEKELGDDQLIETFKFFLRRQQILEAPYGGPILRGPWGLIGFFCEKVIEIYRQQQKHPKGASTK